jgi:hypothetical protein
MRNLAGCMIDNEPPQATKNTCFTDLELRAERAATTPRSKEEGRDMLVPFRMTS